MRVVQKKTAISRKRLPKLGGKVVLEKLPPGLIDGLPKSDQKAITAIVGVPVQFSGYEDDGRVELEFVDDHGIFHSIYVDRQYVGAKKPSSRLPKRRK